MKKFLSLAVAVLVMVGLVGSSFAVSTNDQTIGSSGLPTGLKTPVVMVGYANFNSTAVPFSGYAAGVNSGAADVFKVITIPANCFVEKVTVKMDVLESATSAVTYTVGDSSSATYYMPASPMSNTTMTACSYLTNKFYSAADFISVVPSATATAGRVKVSAYITQF